jgi:energy-converting hydrogenase Eha subunit E
MMLWMAQLETSIPSLAARRSMVRHIIGQAGVALVYLGIVATFAFVTFIACLFWLLIW